VVFMKVFAVVLMSSALAAPSLGCAAETVCPQIAVSARVETAQAELTLADLLVPDVCPQLREAAAGLSLGRAPRVGMVRVLDGREIRRRLEEFADGFNLTKTIGMQIPERIEVRSARRAKSCAEVARFVASAAPAQNVADAAGRRQENLNCAAAGGIANDAALELTRTSWNASRQRWEFALRCARPPDCVPFLVWTREVTSAAPKTQPFRRKTQESDRHESTRISEDSAAELVKPGQTATLTWEQSGLRIVLPVTCLDAGAAGQFVRVRFKNVPRVLRAEVVGKAMLRASL
jgi:hypothetical protein